MVQDVFGLVGSVVAGAYQVQAVVAEGGFAVVYRAEHAGFRAPVALKCLKVHSRLTGGRQQRFLEQFQREAEILFRLSAGIPAVVRPLHVDALRTKQGLFVPFTVLEWLEGETLDAQIARRRVRGQPPFSLPELVSLLTPVARALERAHNYSAADGPVSIAHRDLKPENIFVADVAGERMVKILDFGIAIAKSVASQVAGRESELAADVTSFTPAYGAPEQWAPRRHGQTGPWTDVWGLALTLVEALKGRSPLDGGNAALMSAALDPSRRPTPRSEGLQVTDEVERVFARALAVDPRQRYPHAGAFWDAVVLASSGATVEAPASSSSLPSSRVISTSRTAPTPAVGLPALELDFPQPPSRPERHAAPSSARHALAGGTSHNEIELEADTSFSLALADRPSIRPSAEGESRVAVAPASPSPPFLERPPALGPSGRLLSAAGFQAIDVDPAAAVPTLLHRLIPGVIAMAGSLALTIADMTYAAYMGELLALGPLRMVWLATLLFMVGIGLVVHAVLPRRSS